MRMRARLAWAFTLTALGVMLLVIVAINLGMAWSMGHMMGTGHAMMMPMDPSMAALARWSAGVGLTALALAAVAGWYVADRIAGPLEAVAQAARQMGLRDLSERVPEPKSDDEIADLAREFNRMAERLHHEDVARRQLLADVAHELRHPVAVIQGQLELIQDGVRPMTPENLAGLQDEVIRLGRMIGDLRDLSQAEAGALTLSTRPVQVGETLDSLMATFGPVAEEQGITLEAATAPDTPAVMADPQRLRQVLVNLVSNALRYTPPGGRIRLAARPLSGMVEISVTDTGSGIDPADLPHIFDRFYRGDRSRSRQTGGSGLGLAISRSLVQAHGGTIWAESTPGAGSSFVVQLPAAAG